MDTKNKSIQNKRNMYCLKRKQILILLLLFRSNKELHFGFIFGFTFRTLQGLIRTGTPTIHNAPVGSFISDLMVGAQNNADCIDTMSNSLFSSIE